MSDGTRETTWVECGRIGRAIGLRGEVAVEWMSGACPVAVGGTLFVGGKDSDDDQQTMTVAALRKQGRFSVARFEGIDSRTAAEALRGRMLFLPESYLPKLPDGEYYSYQVLGCEVVTEAGEKLGAVVRIFTAGENDVYEVRPDGGRRGEELLIPAIADVVLSIDVPAKKIVIRPLEGMLD